MKNTAIKLVFLISMFFLALQDKVSANLFNLDSLPIQLVWCGPDNSTAIILTESNSLYISNNNGLSWKNIDNDFNRSAKNEPNYYDGIEIGKVNKIVVSPVDKNIIFLLGTHDFSWFTKDCGNIIEARNYGRKISELIFHPFEKEWILVSAFTIPDDFPDKKYLNYKDIYVSKTFGNDWDLLLSYVDQFSWGIVSENHHKNNGIPKERIIAVYNPKGKGNQSTIKWNYKLDLVYSDNFFRTKKTALYKGNKFLLTENHLYAAQVIDQDLQEVFLFASKSTNLSYSFKQINFINNQLSFNDYRFIDTFGENIILYLNDSEKNSYSEKTYYLDQYDQYSISLSQNVNNYDSYSDFEKVNGVDGVLVANSFYSKQMNNNFNEFEDKVENINSLSNPIQTEYTKTTLITFNYGRKWKKIQAPNWASKRNKFRCVDLENCNLNLHINSRYFPPLNLLNLLLVLF